MFLWSTQNQRCSNFKFRRWFNIDKLNLFWCWNTIIISTLYKEFDFTFRTVEFIWEGRLFQIFGLKTLKLLSPYFTWFGLVTLRFKAFCFDFFENDNLKMLVIRLVIVLYISKHRQCNVTIFIVIFFAMFKTWEWLLSTSLHNSC